MRRATIRPLRAVEEYRQCEQVQNEVWGNHAVTAEVLGVTQKNGGAVIGSLVEAKVVGFIYAFLGRRHGKLLHWSHLMAVLQGYRDRGLGFRMKLAHRKMALAQGVDSIAWTYDPLQSRNAALNLVRLGAEVEEYIPNCYGQFPSRIEKGLPSDRFVVNWHIGSKKVEDRLGGNDPRLNLKLGPLINETGVDSNGHLANRRIRLRLEAPRLLLEVPADTDAIRERTPELGLHWRMETRKIFQHYLHAGYHVSGFLPPTPETAGRCYYVLSKSRRASR